MNTNSWDAIFVTNYWGALQLQLWYDITIWMGFATPQMMNNDMKKLIQIHGRATRDIEIVGCTSNWCLVKNNDKLLSFQLIYIILCNFCISQMRCLLPHITMSLVKIQTIMHCITLDGKMIVCTSNEHAWLNTSNVHVSSDMKQNCNWCAIYQTRCQLLCKDELLSSGTIYNKK